MSVYYPAFVHLNIYVRSLIINYTDKQYKIYHAEGSSPAISISRLDYYFNCMFGHVSCVEDVIQNDHVFEFKSQRKPNETWHI